jgi:hypothetical protein
MPIAVERMVPALLMIVVLPEAPVTSTTQDAAPAPALETITPEAMSMLPPSMLFVLMALPRLLVTL